MNNQALTLNTSWGTSNPTGDFGITKMGGYIGDPIDNIPEYWYQPYTYQPIIKEYYPVYLTNWLEKNKTEQALKIAKKLVDSKKVVIVEVKDFIELINEIISAL